MYPSDISKLKLSLQSFFFFHIVIVGIIMTLKSYRQQKNRLLLPFHPQLNAITSVKLAHAEVQTGCQLILFKLFPELTHFPPSVGNCKNIRENAKIHQYPIEKFILILLLHNCIWNDSEHYFQWQHVVPSWCTVALNFWKVILLTLSVTNRISNHFSCNLFGRETFLLEKSEEISPTAAERTFELLSKGVETLFW